MADDVFVFPLSSAQERLWVLYQLEPASSAYNMPAALRLRGPLALPLLEQAVRALVDRHEILRTTFAVVDGEPAQLVASSLALPVERFDLSRLPEAERQRELARLLASEAERPFDLSEGPLVRVALVRLGERDHVLLWVVHHIAFDGVSTGLVLDEFARLYRALARGEASPLAPLALQYADFADYERRRLASGALAPQIEYWKRELTPDQVLALPTDRPRPEVRRGRGARLFFHVPAALTASVRALAQAENSSLFSALASAYAVLLARLAGADDVRIGTPVTQRTRPELTGLVGNFANTVVLRARLADDPSFRALVQRTHASVQAAQQNGEAPFDRVVDAVKPERDLARAPLCQVLFALQPKAAKPASMGDLESELLDLDSGAAQFDLALELAHDGDALSGALEYDRDLFDAASAEQFVARYLRVLEAASAAPEARVSALAIASADERAALLARGELRGDLPFAPVMQEIRAQAARAPGAIALEQGERRLCYGELCTRVDQLASVLRAYGVGPEVRVGVALARSIEAILAMLATLSAGAAYVPLDPSYPRERITALLERADVALTLVAREHAPALPERGARLVLEGAAELDARPFAPLHMHEQQAAYVIPTSGSTGTPKAVVITQRALASFVAAAAEHYGLRSDDRVLQFASLSFDASVEEIFPTLARGATLVLRDELLVADPARFFAAVEALKLSVLDLPTSFFHRLMAESDAAACMPEALRLIILGGEAARRDAVQTFRACESAHVRLVNSYGPTEGTVVATTFELDGERAAEAGPVPIGAPLPHVQAWVLDRHLEPVPEGVVGELYLGGAALARGYLAEPALTAAAFVPNPHARSAGERLYRTGDRARVRRDGALEFVGRGDQQVKVRGYRVELGEVEARIASLSGVREVLVAVREERAGSAQLVAYVASDRHNADDLREVLAAALPDYMVPAHFVLLPELPKSAQGKLDRRALSALPLSPARAQVGPRDEREAALVEIWRAVLGRDDVSVDDNFFALGGDSITALTVVARARDAGFSLSARTLFQHQTVAALARTLAAPRTAPVTRPASAAASAPLTAIQRWFFEHAGPNPHHWNQSLWLRVRAPLEAPRLERALAALARRHDALRLAFELGPDGYTQRDSGESRLRFVHEALTAAAGEPLERALRELADRQQRALRIDSGPLAIAALVELGRGEQRLLLVAHHLVMDALSLQLVVEELEAVYRGSSSLAEPTPFLCWAEQIGREASSPVRAQRVALAADMPEGRALEADSVRLETRLGGEESEALAAFARARGLSLEALMAAALVAALDPLLNEPEVWLELEGHGRDALDGREDALDVSRTVGWFTRLRSVALKRRGAAAAEQFVAEVARALAEPVADGSYGRADVAFNYLGQWRSSRDPEALFAFADHASGDERNPATPRTHALEVDVASVDGVFRFSYGFSAARYRERTIRELDRRLCDFLRALTAERLDASYALSPLQQGLLFHSVWEPGHDAYVEQVTCRLEGALDVDALRASFQHALALHESLRTVFDSSGEQPTQRVLPQVELALALRDLRALSPEEREREVARSVAEDRAQGFDLARGPLTRLTLLRLRDDAWLFLWTHHHLVLDGWSAALVLRDVFESYQARCSGSALPTAPRGRYRDYITWLASRPRAPAAQFWRDQLGDFEAATALPYAHTPLEGEEPRAQHVAARTLSAAATAQLEAAARKAEVTLNTLLQAAWGFVLARCARSDDVLFGITSAGRSAEIEGVEQIAGLFINTLPLRLRPRAAASVEGYLREVAQRTAACTEYEHSPLVEVRRHSAVAAGQPLFESLLVFENYPADARLERGLPGLAVRDVAFHEETNYPLTLTVSPGRKLAIRVALDPRRFAAAAAPAILRLLEHALFALARGGACALGTLALADAREARALCAAQRATATEFADPRFVHERFAAQAAAHPDAVAVVFGEQRIAYRELEQRANQLAHALRRRGIGADSLVAVLAERSVELVVALLGVLKAGAAYLPVDPDYPRDRIEFMLRDARAAVVISQWPVFARLGLESDGFDLLCLDADRAALESEPVTAPAVRIHPEQLAYTIYTSGSTGRPKGAGNTHHALANRLDWMQREYALTRDDRVLQKTPFSFDVSVWEFFWPLMVGATLVVAAPGDHRDPERLCALIAREHVTTLHFVPPMLEAFLARATARECASLRRVICSGEALSGELARRCLAQLDVALHNLYGPTEAAIDVSAWQCQRDDASGAMPIGRPIANTQLYVLDAAGQLAPDGVAGELCIGGVQLARGYHLRPGLTAERFVPDPFAEVAGSRLYRTGDLARRRSDGAFEFLGRIDHQVKIRGLRVELGEIEARLLAHPKVREAVVVAREAQGTKRLIAYVSGAAESEPLRAFVGETLPAYMVPAQVVVLSALPLSPNGKVDRRALPAPDAPAAAPYVAPRNEVERALAEVWQEVLRVPRVGVHDDFFALGGDSIVSLQVIARAAQRGVVLSPKILFEHPTVAGAAERADFAASPALAPSDSPGDAQAADADLSADAWSDLLAELDR